MGWWITCSKKCGSGVWAENIVDLLNKPTDEHGYFLCDCGEQGYIEKSYNLQEAGETWKPILRGIIKLDPDGCYNPFAFLVSDKPDEPAENIWLSYFKDLRGQGGRLKMGYGPGGPPVLYKSHMISLIKRLKNIGFITEEDLSD
jgi:hypothetical protein